MAPQPPVLQVPGKYKKKEEYTMRSDNVTKVAERAPNRSLF